MNPPFPGMDPYLEQTSLWPDVHAGLITAMRDHLQARIVPHYTAQITPYVALEQVEIAIPRRALVPDVGVYERDQPGQVAADTLVIDAPPLLGSGTLPVETRYGRIEIRAVNSGLLITTIELLSPVNKRPGVGIETYERKRQELLLNGINLLELDLLRAGQRPSVARPEPLPDEPYFIFLHRAERWPEIAIWPCSLRQPLPTVPVPLRTPDPDVALPLTTLLYQVYRNARYDVQIDYRETPPPPALSPDDTTWLIQQLQAQRV